MCWWRRKKNKQQKNEDIKKPESSYDIYNQNETLTLQHDINNDLLVAYDEEQKGVQMKTTKKTTASTKQSKTRTTTTTVKKEGRNIYYVSARKDKDGKKLGWEVKKENAEKITKLCNTKEEAIAFVREKAGNQGSTCIIRKLDGSIEKTLKFD